MKEDKVRISSIRRITMRRLPIVRFLTLVIWTFVVALVFHHRAFAPELRYTRVAEGNISHTVHSLWSDGMGAYTSLLREDAQGSGRVRPLHCLYHSVPFLLTMVRNGDLFHKDREVPVSDRINGDLQTHVLYLFVSLVIAITVLAWLIWRLTGVWWSAFLLPLYAVSGVTVSENFLVNYCDSGEVAQLLFVSLYLFFVARMFTGETPGWKAEVAGSLFLFMAYTMKETSVVLSPVILAFLAWRFFFITGDNTGFRKFAVRHAAIHVVFAVILLSLVYLHKAGEYVSVNYQLQGDLWDRLERSYKIMCLAVPVLPMIAVGGALFCMVSFVPAVRRFIQCPVNDRIPLVVSAGIVFVAVGVSAGFWAINLPWSGVLVKYYLPVFTFASVAALLIQILVQQLLWRQGLYVASILWVAGSIVFMVKDLGALRGQAEIFYKNYYEYRKVVPFVTMNIGENVSQVGTSRRIHIVAGQLFQEGALPFWRWLNRFHDLNIAQGGRIVSTINACERNYFRRYPNRPAVEVTMSDKLPGTLDADDVYLLGDVIQKDEQQQVELLGYSFCMDRSIGSPGIRVARYMRRQP